jgi:hypothetical protein
MENLVKFPLANGECVVVQIDPNVAPGPLPAANKSGVMREALMGFEEAAAKLRPIAQGLLEQVKDLGPDETRLEFTVGFCAEAGLILAKAGADGHCKLRMVWKKR